MLYEVLPPSDGMVVNYGVNRVRFPTAVPSGGRACEVDFRVLSVGDASGGERATRGAAVESEDVAKPVCVAELVLLTVP